MHVISYNKKVINLIDQRKQNILRHKPFDTCHQCEIRYTYQRFSPTSHVSMEMFERWHRAQRLCLVYRRHRELLAFVDSIAKNTEIIDEKIE